MTEMRTDMADGQDRNKGFTIEKRGYSARPWRIITPEGRELYLPKYLDLRDAPGVYPDPAGGDTKTEAILELGRYAWRLHQAALGAEVDG